VKSDDIKALLYLALIGGGAYLAYQGYQAIIAALNKVGTGVSTAAAAASSNVADTVQSIIGNGIAQPGGTYTVTLADGSVQTVPYGQLPVQSTTNGLGAMRRRIRMRVK